MAAGVLLIAAALFVLLHEPAPASQLSSLPAGSSISVIPQELPDLTLTSLDGKSVSLRDLRGQAVVLNFWATWCPPCREEMPDLDTFHRAGREDDVIVVAINAGESSSLVEEFVDELEPDFQVLLDPDMKAMNAFRVVSLPTSFFIDRQGIIQDRHAGALSLTEVENRMASLR
jgi:thiol-disulfide isomerase/thioredoxin